MRRVTQTIPRCPPWRASICRFLRQTDGISLAFPDEWRPKYEDYRGGRRCSRQKIDSGRFYTGPEFFSDDGDFLQIGSWNYQAGQQLAAHNHNIVPRSTDRTQEFIVLLRGSLRADIYTEDDEFVESVVINAGEGLLNLSGGHGYEILEDDTIVIESKNGPYPGADADRRRLDPDA